MRGRALAGPAIIREKNTPIDSEVPEFWKVTRIPEATPQYSARHARHDREVHRQHQDGGERPFRQRHPGAYPDGNSRPR
ncbi:MAG: hypothetical protein ACRDNF_05270 [Streptosporangiaceae bacterium]